MQIPTISAEPRLCQRLSALAVVVAAITSLGIIVPAQRVAHVSVDEPQYLLSATSLWEDGDLDISDELADERYRAYHQARLPEQATPLGDGRRVSPHDPLLPVLLAVPMGLFGWVGAKAFLALMAGTLAALTAWVAIRRFDVEPVTASVITGLLALSPPLAVYATQVYPEVPAALAVMTVVAVLTSRARPTAAAVVVVAVIALPWLAVKYVPVAAVLAVWALWWAPARLRTVVLAALAVAGAVYVLGHLWIYEGLTAYAAGDHFVGGEFTAVGTGADPWGRSVRLVGLLVDRGFGLAAWQPAWLVAPVAVVTGLRAGTRSLRLAASVVGIGWVVATFVALTMHGWWFPGRQVVVVLPVAALLISRWVDRAPARRAVVTALGAVGVGAFGWLVAEGAAGDVTWIIDFASTSYPPYLLLAPVLPDYMAPSTTTWILHAVWTALVVVAVMAAWRWRRMAVRAPSDPPDLGGQSPS